MTAPYFNPNGNGAPAPAPQPQQGAQFAPPGPAQYQPQPAWQGYPASALPPLPQQQAQQPFGPGVQQPAQQGGFQPVQPGQQIPGQFVQPQTQPQPYQQPAQQAPMAQPGLDPQTRLSGPQFPAELQGKTLAEATAMYAEMRQLALANVQRQTQQQQQQAQPQGFQQPPNGQPQQGNGTPAFDWRNPAPAIAEVVRREIAPMIQPLQQQQQMQAAASARTTVAQEIGPQQFAELEPQMIQYLQGADPQALTNPDIWRIAARTALGDRALRGGLQQQRQPGGYAGAVPFQPGMQNPAPTAASFFTESPGQGQGPAQPGGQLTPGQMWFADAMGVSYQDYAAYAQGVQGQNGGRR